MKKIGVIMRYDSYEEYRNHMQEMLKGGYVCMDFIPEGMESSYYQYIRYTLKEENN